MISPDATVYFWFFDKDDGEVGFADELIKGVAAAWHLTAKLSLYRVLVYTPRNGWVTVGHYEVLDAG